jgi:hypothetical protein
MAKRGGTCYCIGGVVMNIRKRFLSVPVYLFVLALAGVSFLKSDELGRVPGKAVVRTVHGRATCPLDGKSHDLKANMELEAGVTITAGPNSYAYLNVNGTTSSVRVAADTTLVLKTMDRIGPREDGDTQTMLVLQVGSLLGHVSKDSANSKYEITTPCGVAEIHGADWNVAVTQLGDGQYEATFEAVKGKVVASGPVNSIMQTKTLKDGETWTVGRDVAPVERRLLQRQLDQIHFLTGATGTPGVGFGGPPPGQAPAAGAVPPGPRR